MFCLRPPGRQGKLFGAIFGSVHGLFIGQEIGLEKVFPVGFQGCGMGHFSPLTELRIIPGEEIFEDTVELVFNGVYRLSLAV